MRIDKIREEDLDGEVKTYTSGKKYLEYEKYNNHLADYIKELEPELYQQKLEEDSDNKDE